VLLLLSVALGASAVSIGFACLGQFGRASERQQATESFDKFTEEAMLLSAEGVGGTRPLDLRLGEAKIIVRGTLAELAVENQVLRAAVLPLPVSASELKEGVYFMELKRGSSGLFIEVRGD
jgi:hypothetical protein